MRQERLIREDGPCDRNGSRERAAHATGTSTKNGSHESTADATGKISCERTAAATERRMRQIG